MPAHIGHLEHKGLNRVAAVAVTRTQDRIWFSYLGRSWSIANPDAIQVRSSQSGSGANGSQSLDGWVRSPMPGKVIKIAVTSGQDVEPGTVAVILEAMKMEYVLKIQTKGRVASVTCTVGQLVKLGESLVEVKED